MYVHPIALFRHTYFYIYRDGERHRERENRGKGRENRGKEREKRGKEREKRGREISMIHKLKHA